MFMIQILIHTSLGISTELKKERRRYKNELRLQGKNIFSADNKNNSGFAVHCVRTKADRGQQR